MSYLGVRANRVPPLIRERIADRWLSVVRQGATVDARGD
jgi:hypothetical protein